MLTRIKTLVRILGLMAIVLAAGCAPAYHDYSGCQINCRYCLRPPLAYKYYTDCVCHSCAASNYLSDTQPTTEEVLSPNSRSEPQASDSGLLLHP